jgi:hypothetical protein
VAELRLIRQSLTLMPMRLDLSDRINAVQYIATATPDCFVTGRLANDPMAHQWDRRSTRHSLIKQMTKRHWVLSAAMPTDLMMRTVSKKQFASGRDI